MRTEDLLEAISGVDDELLERSEKVKIKKDISWQKWMPLVACLCLVLGIRFLVFPSGFGMGSSKDDAAMESATESMWGNMMGDGAGAPSDDAKDVMNGGSASCDGKESFDNVYALAMSEPNDAINGTRQVEIDITKTDSEYTINIEDGYTLYNTSGEDVEAEFAYTYNMDHNGTRPIFVDEDGKVLGKAGSPLQVTIPANGQLTIKAQYSKSMALEEESTDWFIHGCKFTNLDVTESIITINCEGNVETIEIDPIEDYYFMEEIHETHH